MSQIHAAIPSRGGDGAPVRPALVPDLVATHTRHTPDATAIVHGDRTMTYAELDAQATQLAHRLARLGGGREAVVGLALGRSPELLIGALGILRCGAAYAPLDPAQPADRLAFIVGDARLSAIVSIADIARRLPPTDAPLVLLDRDAGPLDAGSSAMRAAHVGGEDLAYVIYTSGSTGQPKGVEVTHGALANLVQWHRRAFGITPADRATLFASPAFDASVWETWPYLAAGATLVVVDDDVRVDAVGLRDWLIARRITTAFVPTPLAERLIALPWPGHAALRTLLTGADTLHRHPPAGLPFTLVNNYGPTEATVVATSGVVEATGSTARPAIGRPVDGVQVWILDEHGEPVARDAAGELHIGGAGVARGYRNRPGLTAQRFVPDPFGDMPGARLYRTGDRARWRADGQIEFLGRIDDQLKIRGYRVDPDEVAAALGRHPGVLAAAVAAHDDALVGYVVAAQSALLTAADLQATVRQAVPEYMVPSVFVRMDALPLTTSGKVDRRALPAPDGANTVHDRGFVAPRTAVEERLARILTGLLDMDRISVEDNFFLLGGHSLLGAQLIARIRDVFGVDLPLRTVFDVPSVATLAAVIEDAIVARLTAAGDDGAPVAA